MGVQNFGLCTKVALLNFQSFFRKFFKVSTENSLTMDISDLLLFKPETIPKRKQDEDEEKPSSSSKATKKPKFDEKILSLIDSNEDNDEDSGEVLDEMGLKKLALVFEKRVLNNQKMRLKYGEDPQKFMVSWLVPVPASAISNTLLAFRSRRLTCTTLSNSFKLSPPSPIFTL